MMHTYGVSEEVQNGAEQVFTEEDLTIFEQPTRKYQIVGYSDDGTPIVMIVEE